MLLPVPRYRVKSELKTTGWELILVWLPENTELSAIAQCSQLSLKFFECRSGGGGGGAGPPPKESERAFAPRAHLSSWTPLSPAVGATPGAAIRRVRRYTPPPTSAPLSQHSPRSPCLLLSLPPSLCRLANVLKRPAPLSVLPCAPLLQQVSVLGAPECSAPRKIERCTDYLDIAKSAAHAVV